MSEALEAAIQCLREANPDPSVVEALAAKTTNERNNPHTFANLFVRGMSPMSGMVICKLCGMATLENQPVIHLTDHPATLHVNWHNQLHRAEIETA